MTFTIPEWALWLGGGVIALSVLALAAIGAFFLYALPGRFWR